eukprot:32157-Pyramimonas_sp.AAC.1
MWAFGGGPYGATKRVRGVPKWVRWAHANAGIWVFGRAPSGVKKRVKGCAKIGGHMRTLALELSVGLPMEPRNV